MNATMRAVRHDRYGTPDVLQLRQVERPVPDANQVLVRVHAAAVNPVEWHRLTGTPYVIRRRMGGLRRPANPRLGTDFAGTVEAVGAEVTSFRPGDEVFGAADGSFAEYVCVREQGSVVPMPAGLTFEQAASVPVAAISALQGLRDHGRLQPGHQVLINGASGGVGTFAVQIAKTYGAEVTGVCGPQNTELVRSLGADHVIDYTREDATRGGRRYDVLLDTIGTWSWARCQRVLQPRGSLVLVGGLQTNRLTGPLVRWRWFRLAARLRARTVRLLQAHLTKADLEVVRELLETGKVTPVIDRRYKLDEIADALRYLGTRHARGKVVITL